jgi:hypothetical protein
VDRKFGRRSVGGSGTLVVRAAMQREVARRGRA